MIGPYFICLPRASHCIGLETSEKLMLFLSGNSRDSLSWASLLKNRTWNLSGTPTTIKKLGESGERHEGAKSLALILSREHNNFRAKQNPRPNTGSVVSCFHWSMITDPKTSWEAPDNHFTRTHSSNF